MPNKKMSGLLKAVIALLIGCAVFAAAFFAGSASVDARPAQVKLIEGDETIVSIEPAWAHSLTFTSVAEEPVSLQWTTESGSSGSVSVTETPASYTIELDERVSELTFSNEEWLPFAVSDVKADTTGRSAAFRGQLLTWAVLIGAAAAALAAYLLCGGHCPALLTFVLTLSGGCMLALLRPDTLIGWDEVTHNEMLALMTGDGVQGLAQWLANFNLWMVGYIPQALGILVGRLFGVTSMLPAYLGAALTLALAGAAAVHFAPRFKLSFMLLAFVPTALFQTCTATYDVMVYACCLLGTALWLRAFDSDEKLTFDAALPILALFALGTVAKPVYVLLLPLLLILPGRKFSGRGQHVLWIVFVVILAAAVLASLILPGPYDSVRGGDSRYDGADSGAQVRFILGQPLQALGILLGSFFGTLPVWLTDGLISWGYLGRMLMPGWVLLVLLFLSSLWLGGEKNGRAFGPGRRVAMAALALLPVFALLVTQYCVSSAVGGSVIEGMQARYVLPVLALLLLAVSLPGKLRERLNLRCACIPAAVLLACAAPFWLSVLKLIAA